MTHTGPMKPRVTYKMLSLKGMNADASYYMYLYWQLDGPTIAAGY